MDTKKVLIALYFIISTVYLVADNFGFPYLTIAMKPLLLSTLLFYFLQVIPSPKSSFSKFIIIGLIFSFIGDTLLIFDGDLFFIFGLLSFLVTHLFYTRSFLLIAKSTLLDLFVKQKIAVFLFMALWISLMTFLWNDLNSLRWPVLLYSSVICMMGLTAYNLKGVTSVKIFSLIFFGALLFIFSDSMIAVDKFKSGQLNLPFPRLLIMIPYIIAQFMIVEGCIEWENRRK